MSSLGLFVGFSSTPNVAEAPRSPPRSPLSTIATQSNCVAASTALRSPKAAIPTRAVGKEESAQAEELMFLRIRQQAKVLTDAGSRMAPSDENVRPSELNRTERLYLDARRRDAILDAERAQLNAQRAQAELSECTFVPQTNHNRPSSSRSVSATSSTTKTSATRSEDRENTLWFERLAQPCRPTLERLQRDAALHELLDGPTFTPRINHNFDSTLDEWKRGVMAHDRLHGEAVVRQQRRGAREAIKEEQEIALCQRPPSVRSRSISDVNKSATERNHCGIPLLVERDRQQTRDHQRCRRSQSFVPPSTAASREASAVRGASLRSASVASAKSGLHSVQSPLLIQSQPTACHQPIQKPPTEEGHTSKLVQSSDVLQQQREAACPPLSGGQESPSPSPVPQRHSPSLRISSSLLLSVSPRGRPDEAETTPRDDYGASSLAAAFNDYLIQTTVDGSGAEGAAYKSAAGGGTTPTRDGFKEEASFEPLSPLSEEEGSSCAHLPQRKRSAGAAPTLRESTAPRHIDPTTGNPLLSNPNNAGCAKHHNTSTTSSTPLPPPTETHAYKLYKQAQVTKKERLHGPDRDVVLLQLARQTNDLLLEMNNRTDVLNADFITRQTTAQQASQKKRDELEKLVLQEVTKPSKELLEARRRHGVTARCHSQGDVLRRLQRPLKRHETAKRATSEELRHVEESRRRFQGLLHEHNKRFSEGRGGGNEVMVLGQRAPSLHAQQRVVKAVLSRQLKRELDGDAAFQYPYVTRQDDEDMRECTFAPTINHSDAKAKWGGATSVAAASGGKSWRRPPTIPPRWPKWMIAKPKSPKPDDSAPNSLNNLQCENSTVVTKAQEEDEDSPVTCADALSPTPPKAPGHRHQHAHALLHKQRGTVVHLPATALSPQSSSRRRCSPLRGPSIATVASPVDGRCLFSPIRVHTAAPLKESAKQPPPPNLYNESSDEEGTPNHGTTATNSPSPAPVRPSCAPLYAPLPSPGHTCPPNVPSDDDDGHDAPRLIAPHPTSFFAPSPSVQRSPDASVKGTVVSPALQQGTAPPQSVQPKGTPTEIAYNAKFVQRQRLAREWRATQQQRLTGRPVPGMWQPPVTSKRVTRPPARQNDATDRHS